MLLLIITVHAIISFSSLKGRAGTHTEWHVITDRALVEMLTGPLSSAQLFIMNLKAAAHC